jgi:uncharacterized protein YggE
MKRLIILVVAGLHLGISPSLAKGPTIVVRGDGDIEVVPDIASMRIEVRSRDKDPEKAQAKNVEVTKRLFSAFEEVGIKRSDMGSTSYTFKRDATSNNEGKIIELGYYVENSVQLKVFRFDLLPRLVAVAVANGATSIGDVSYTLEDDRPYIDKARTEAFQKVKEEAQKSAIAAGMTLGPIVTVSLGGAYIPDQLTAGSLDRGEADVAAPGLQPLLNPGTVHVQYSVTVEYELK